MLVVCPDCGATGQEAGKFCENCGRLLDNVAPPDAAGVAGVQAGADPGSMGAPGTPGAAADGGSAGQGAPGVVSTGPALAPAGVFAGPPVGVANTDMKAHFAIVHDDQADPDDGFTITRSGEFLVGRLDSETGSPVDIDLRQWVKAVEVDGRQQYLIHRHQCYLGLTMDGVALIRACPGAELDTLVRPVGQTNYTSLQQFGTVRPALPGSDSMPGYPLQPGDRIFVGDPEVLHETDNPKALGTYLIMELLAS